MVIRLKHPSRMIKDCKMGFSWTTLFFGCLPAFFRGDWKWGLIILVLGMITYGASSIIFAFIYNGIYIKDLLKEGYQPADEKSRHALVNKGWIEG